jgi:sugar O-acyltransferase (sialic acid O-acetyltransferase NeuD family)
MRAYEILGYVNKDNKGAILEVPHIGDDQELEKFSETNKVTLAVLGIGHLSDCARRVELYQQMTALGYRFPKIVSPHAIVNEAVEIGDGTVVMDGVVVNSGARIGKCCILNTRSAVDHDCELGDFVHLAPGGMLSGGVNVGSYTFIGAHATVINYKKIAEKCIIGAGAVVVRDCLESGTYVGVPARIVKGKHSAHKSN